LRPVYERKNGCLGLSILLTGRWSLAADGAPFVSSLCVPEPGSILLCRVYQHTAALRGFPEYTQCETLHTRACATLGSVGRALVKPEHGADGAGYASPSAHSTLAAHAKSAYILQLSSCPGLDRGGNAVRVHASSCRYFVNL